MKKLFTLTTCWLMVTVCSYSQVKNNYQYNTSMPYGTLDIRTRISSSDYYYLQENRTYSFRESSPGVRTNTYVDMTGWDSSPYDEGNLRRKRGTTDEFVMNYRLLKPNGYKSTYTPGYPLIVHLHGAHERANCLYDDCYHSDWDYTVQENSPPAPKTATHKLLNNDHNLNVGGKHYMDARNLAGTRLPNDPSMPNRAFPGFVVVPQMFNSWDSLQVQDVVRIVRLLTEEYNIDEDRIYIQGLSIGGYAVFESMKRASWLFAAALPMGGVWDANIFSQNQQSKVAHMPVWIFQGGKDKRPSPAYTAGIVSGLENAGAEVRYSLYSDLGHVVWYRAYGQSDYYNWILKQDKSRLHVASGITVIDKSKSQYPKLMLAEGFLAYQWEKDGAIISNTSHNLTVTSPGKYRARFSRKSGSPTEAQWNKWSQTVTITGDETSTPTVSVSITNPDNGQVFIAPASINITATASASSGSLSKVEFYNGSTKLGEDATSPYSFTWGNVSAGSYSLKAKAIHTSGPSSTATVSITVKNNTDPTVNITNPDDGQSFTAPASISFTATASDSDGSVARVEFYNGSTKLGQDTSSPYTFTWSNVQAGNYSLVAKAIDNSGASTTDQVSVTVTSGSGGDPGETCASTGSILAETWTGIPGREISSIPLNTSPASVITLNIFETPANRDDSYGTRVRGFICPPATGNYTFWVASNDSGELWLSTDESPANKSRIAYVTGYTNPRQWDKQSSQKSGTVSLVAGRRYYIEALLKEGSGSDHLSVGWQLPGGALERPIPGSRLIRFEGSSNASPTVSLTSPNNNQSFTAPASISFTATASDSDGSVARVEFYNGSTKLGQDTSSPYTFTWSNVAAGSYSLMAKAIDNAGASATDQVSVTVTAGSGGEPCASTGSIIAETWTGISGKDISSIPLNTTPASVRSLNVFETPANVGDNYGTRVRGYICPPATGSYTFWVASNDSGELWLSTDDNPANKSRIAYVTGYTNPRQWDKQTSQKSGAINLVAGRRYYIEALLKEGTGTDHLSVGWQLPGGALERPIAGSRLIPFGSSPPPTTDPDPEPDPSTGVILAETWTGISGKSISSIPVDTSPDDISELTIFETPRSIGDNYGTRVRGYVHATATGDYTFWISSDDSGELWLSSDENPSNKTKIAYVSGWTYSRQWDKFTTQKSSAIRLVAGRKYYIEALLKEATGGDDMAVGWQLPGGALERPIPGSRLSKFGTATATMVAQPMETTTEARMYEQISVYPNPAESADARLTVSGYEGITETIQTEVEIINMTGEVVFAEKISCGGGCSDYLININKQLTPGVYLVNLKTNGARFSKRLFVK